MTPAQRNALAAAFLALLGGIVGGSILLSHPDADLRHVALAWDGGRPASVSCFEFDGLSTPAARSTFGLDPDGGSYAHIRMGVDTTGWDGGEAKVTLPAGYTVVSVTEKQVADTACTNRFEAWLPSASAPFGCACAPALPDGGTVASTCEYLAPDGGWVAGPARMTLPEGKWRGGCQPKVCTEIAGSSSWDIATCGPESLP
jgi:hypothetical protein